MASGFIGQVHIDSTDYKIGSTLFAVLDTNTTGLGIITTNNGTKIFTVPLEGFINTTGVTVHIKFVQANSDGADLALKVGGDQPHPISNPNGALTWQANSVISFTYDGTNWVMNSSQVSGGSLSNVTFGNIQSNGTLQQNDVTIANGDKLVITDASDSNKIARASLAFGDTADGTFLNNTGAWSTPADTKYGLVVGASNSATSNAAVNATTNSLFVNLLEDGTVKHAHSISGDGSVTVSSDASGNITINGTKSGTVTSVQVAATSPVESSVNTAQTGTLSTTISLADAYGDTKNPYGTKTANTILAGPASGNAAVPDFRALVEADIPSAIARLASPAFTGAPTAPTVADVTDSSTNIATTAFVAAAINAKFSANDAMQFKGTIGTNGTPGTLPTNGYQAGWTYRVITAGTYAGQVCEVGDLIIAINDGPASGSSVVAADWTIAQTNIDGSIYMGNNNLTSGQLLIADGTTGKIKTSGYTIATPAAAGDLLVASSTTAYNSLSIGTAGQVLTVSGGVPVWSDAQHYISHLFVTSASGTADTTSILSNGNVYLRLFDTSTARETHKISGAGATTVTTDTSANIIITSTDTQFTSAGSANALTSLTLAYNDGTPQSETPSSATFVGTVSRGVLYLKSIVYGTTSVSTGVTAVT